MSDWRQVLKEACDRYGQAEVGRRLDYHRSAICQIVNGYYKADTKAVAAAVMKIFKGGKIVEIPEGYKEDGLGRLVPLATIKEIDLARDELVREIVHKAQEHAKAVAAIKAQIIDDIQAFVELSAEKYGAHMGGKKGNVTLTSFDGHYKIQRAVNEHLVFDERLQVAKSLIDECIREWTPGSRDEIQALINDAFQVDKEGRIDTKRILSLRRLDIKNEKWLKAMQAISDSLMVAGSRTYVRIYERVGQSDQYVRLNLDMSAAY